MLFVLSVVYSLELQAFCAEIYEQTDALIIRLEVVFGLRQVGIRQFDYRLQFDADDAFHQEINSPQAYLSPLVKYTHFVLTAERDACIRHFHFQRSLVDDFLEAISQR